jgi:hypothetical protein
MTKQEFLKQLHSKDRDYVLRGWIAFTLVIMAGVAIWVALRFGGDPVISKLLYGFVAVTVIASTTILLFWDMGRGVRCSSCPNRLFGTAADITSATGNCAYCGEKVFDQSVEQNKS